MNLTLCTWNISFGKQIKTVSDLLLNSPDFKNVDIFAFQEASIHEDIPDAKYIAKSLGGNFGHFQVKAQISKNMEQGNAIIWNKDKVKVTRKQTIILPDYQSANLGKIEYAIKKAVARESRNCVMIEGVRDNKTFRIYNTHLDMIGFDLRRKQLLSIIEKDSKKRKVDLVIITGDFNTFRIFTFPRWKKFNDEAQKFGFDDITNQINWTFHRKLIRYRQKLDIIFLKDSDKIRHKTSLIKHPGSDHFPIFATLRF